jgi:hypothetical protein
MSGVPPKQRYTLRKQCRAARSALMLSDVQPNFDTMRIGDGALSKTRWIVPRQRHGAGFQIRPSAVLKLGNHANVAVRSRLPKSPALGCRTFFSGEAVAIFQCH